MSAHFSRNPRANALQAALFDESLRAVVRNAFDFGPSPPGFSRCIDRFAANRAMARPAAVCSDMKQSVMEGFIDCLMPARRAFECLQRAQSQAIGRALC